jgi:hypothetical protein
MPQPHCLLTANSHSSLGDNLNGPCVIEVPAWVKSPLGKYYMYFAHHKGRFIRLAYANSLVGPWRVHAPGVLSLHETPFVQDDLPEDAGIEYDYAHVASPNVHIAADEQEIVMYYHGLEEDGSQPTRVCSSTDGLTFQNHSVPLTDPYFAGFEFRSDVFGITWGGRLHRGNRWDGPFEGAPEAFASAMLGPDGETVRHCGVELDGDLLSIYFTRIGDAPERILRSQCSLTENWLDWRASPPVEILRAALPWEGVNQPITKSRIGTAQPMEHALRDPFPFRGHIFYAGGGESVIGIAQLPDH